MQSILQTHKSLIKTSQMLGVDSDNLQAAIQDCLIYIENSELKNDVILTRLFARINQHSWEVENSASTILERVCVKSLN
jgi:hypothetical protein